MLTTRNKLIASGALAVAMSLVIGVSLSGPDKATRDATHEAIGSALAAGSAVGPAGENLDTGQYRDAIKDVRDADATAIDLLTASVEPGAEVTATVTIDKGKRTTGVVEFIGPASASFGTIEVTYDDGDAASKSTRVQVKARNKGTTAARMIAFVRLVP